MKKLSNSRMESVGAGWKPRLATCLFYTATTVVTVPIVPIAGAALAGFTASCWAGYYNW